MFAMTLLSWSVRFRIPDVQSTNLDGATPVFRDHRQKVGLRRMRMMGVDATRRFLLYASPGSNHGWPEVKGRLLDDLHAEGGFRS
ncbi:MAG: hypothetical protein KIT31_02450 [Deltaproteobacteria bacterium]|nr:hypothetical protein [Deltaproteobacteria bacterium]